MNHLTGLRQLKKNIADKLRSVIVVKHLYFKKSLDVHSLVHTQGVVTFDHTILYYTQVMAILPTSASCPPPRC